MYLKKCLGTAAFTEWMNQHISFIFQPYINLEQLLGVQREPHVYSVHCLYLNDLILYIYNVHQSDFLLVSECQLFIVSSLMCNVFIYVWSISSNSC